MTDVQAIYDQLAQPFPVELIEWRVGPTNARNRQGEQPLRGQPLCYVDARTVMDRLDTVCGFDGWQCNYTPGVGASIACNIGLRLAGDWLWKADGAGATDMEAEKGTFSDAFKRAAVRWGVARYLYDLKAPWIELEKRGDSGIIPAAAKIELDRLHEEFARKANWGEGVGIPVYRFLLTAIQDTVTKANARAFEDKHAPQIAQLPVAMRKHILSTLGKIGND